MTVRQLLAEMDSAEFAEWIAFDRLEPIGPVRGDLQAASICAVMANCHRGKRGRRFKLSDFLLRFGKPEPKKQTWQDMKASMMRFAAANKGRIVRKARRREGS